MAIKDYYRPLTFRTKTSIPNGFGGTIDTWGDAFVVQGLINQASSTEISQAAQFQMQIDSKLFCDVDSFNVYDESGYRITYRVRDSIEDNKEYEIKSVPKNTVNKRNHWKLLIKRLDTNE